MENYCRLQYPGSEKLLIQILMSLALIVGSGSTQAVPAFANQTGQGCVACHAGGQFPELTPYGRQFKLNGYTFGDRAIPLSIMAVATITNTKNTNTSRGGGNPAADFPKDGTPVLNTESLFIAGKINDHIGGFVQITRENYDSQNQNGSWVGKTTADNMDFRYTDFFISNGRKTIVGLTLNNNPTVQDVWNSAPAWGFSSVPHSNGPPISALLDGGLSQQVTGLGAYGYWDNSVYAELTTYRNATGAFNFMSAGLNPADGSQAMVDGFNPYWRLAYTHEWGPQNIMVGTYGMIAHLYPDSLMAQGATDKYRDVGLDAQYQYLLEPHTLTAQINYLRENRSYADAASNPGFFDVTGVIPVADPGSTDSLNMLRAKATYIYKSTYGACLQFFNITGSTNTATLTAGYVDNSGAVSGSGGLSGNITGNPGSRGFTYEAFGCQCNMSA